MVIMGIDPGFSFTGFAILKKLDNKVVLLDYGCLRLPSSKSLQERIVLFHDFCAQKIEHWHVQLIALETPFLGKNAQNFLKLGYLRGIVYLLAGKSHLQLFEFSPREIKLSLTGYGAAEKDQVARVVLRLFPGLIQPDKLDVTDALAVTLCGMWKYSVLS